MVFHVDTDTTQAVVVELNFSPRQFKLLPVAIGTHKELLSLVEGVNIAKKWLQNTV